MIPAIPCILKQGEDKRTARSKRISLSILPAIILANIPGRQADAHVTMRTMAVRLGNKNAARLALFYTVAAVVAAVVIAPLIIIDGLLTGLDLLASFHAVGLNWLLQRYIRRGAPDGRLDGLIIIALTFMGWFLFIPAWNVLSR
jgi:hypothetical protein